MVRDDWYWIKNQRGKRAIKIKEPKANHLILIEEYTINAKGEFVFTGKKYTMNRSKIGDKLTDNEYRDYGFIEDL